MTNFLFSIFQIILIGTKSDLRQNENILQNMKKQYGPNYSPIREGFIKTIWIFYILSWFSYYWPLREGFINTIWVFFMVGFKWHLWAYAKIA